MLIDTSKKLSPNNRRFVLIFRIDAAYTCKKHKSADASEAKRYKWRTVLINVVLTDVCVQE